MGGRNSKAKAAAAALKEANSKTSTPPPQSATQDSQTPATTNGTNGTKTAEISSNGTPATTLPASQEVPPPSSEAIVVQAQVEEVQIDSNVEEIVASVKNDAMEPAEKVTLEEEPFTNLAVEEEPSAAAVALESSSTVVVQEEEAAALKEEEEKEASVAAEEPKAAGASEEKKEVGAKCVPSVLLQLQLFFF